MRRKLRGRTSRWTVTDVDFLGRAAVLARIEFRDADPNVQRRLQQVHNEACRRCLRAIAA